MSERFKVPVLKTGALFQCRGFESLSIRMKCIRPLVLAHQCASTLTLVRGLLVLDYDDVNRRSNQPRTGMNSRCVYAHGKAIVETQVCLIFFVTSYLLA